MSESPSQAMRDGSTPSGTNHVSQTVSGVGQVEGSGCNAAGTWRDALPEDLRGSPAISKFNDVAALAKSYIHAQQMIGRERIPMPSSEEDILRLMDRLGRPEEAGDYDLVAPELPQSVELDSGIIEGFQATAHQLGLLPRQAQGLFNWYLTTFGEQYSAAEEQAAKASEAQIAELRQEWGAAFDEKVELARRAVSVFGGSDLAKFLDEARLSSHPALVRAFAAAGQSIAEDNADGRGKAQFTLTPGEAKREIAQIQANPDYWDAYRNPVRHEELVGRAGELFRLAYPEHREERQ